MAYEIKERSLGEILDGAFQLYRNHFGVFLGVALCVGVPSSLLVALVNWLATGNIDVSQALDAANSGQLAGAEASGAPPLPALGIPTRALVATTIGLPIMLLGQVLQDAVLTHSVSDAYLGRPLSVGSGMRRGFSALWRLVGAGLLKAPIGLGLMCLIVPGILLMIRWMFTTQAIVIEDHTARASLERSRDLAAENYGRLFLLFVILAALGFGLPLGLEALVPEAVDDIPVLGHLVRYVPQILVSPIASAAITLCYFDLRVRKEGFDMERLAHGLGQPPAGVALGS